MTEATGTTRHRRFSGRPLRGLPLALLGLGLMLTALVTYYLFVMNNAQDELRFLNAASEAEENVKSRLVTDLTLLRGTAGLFSASATVEQAEFSDYVSHLHLDEHYPGVLGIGFAKVWPRGRVSELLSEFTKQGQAALAPLPATTDGIGCFTLFLAPHSKRLPRSIGVDMTQSPELEAAMTQARDTGAPAVSGRVLLEQESDPRNRTGVVLFLPVFSHNRPMSTVEERRAAIDGFVYAPLRTRDLFEGSLSSGHSLLSLDVYDGPPAPENTLLAKPLPNDASSAYADLHKEVPIAAAGRTWTLSFRPSNELATQSGRHYLVLVMFGGLVVSAGLYALSRVQVIARLSAERTALELQTTRDAAIAAHQEAEEASRLKDEFLATLSHELRTPLNAIVGWTSLLQNGILPDGERGRALETIARNGRALAQLVDDLLDVSRITTGKLRLELELIDGAALITEAIEAIKPTAKIRRIKLETNIDESLGRFSADPARLRQIIWNLMSNALKFTPPEGNVSLTASRRDDVITMVVRDDGQGIVPAFLPHVFERFRQADGSTTRAQGGLGLGLAIVRHLVELHGGQVRAESEGEGKGATFTVQLPASMVLPSIKLPAALKLPARRAAELDRDTQTVEEGSPDADTMSR